MAYEPSNEEIIRNKLIDLSHRLQDMQFTVRSMELLVSKMTWIETAKEIPTKSIPVVGYFGQTSFLVPYQVVKWEQNDGGKIIWLDCLLERALGNAPTHWMAVSKPLETT